MVNEHFIFHQEFSNLLGVENSVKSCYLVHSSFPLTFVNYHLTFSKSILAAKCKFNFWYPLDSIKMSIILP